MKKKDIDNGVFILETHVHTCGIGTRIYVGKKYSYSVVGNTIKRLGNC